MKNHKYSAITLFSKLPILKELFVKMAICVFEVKNTADTPEKVVSAVFLTSSYWLFSSIAVMVFSMVFRIFFSFFAMWDATSYFFDETISRGM